MDNSSKSNNFALIVTSEKMTTISIIIVNFNTLHVLQPCIDSIVEHTIGVDYEIIVVDNGSSDGSVKVLAEDKRIVFVPIDDNLGFGRANNIGLKHAQGEYIFFLNSDTLLKNNAIKMLYDFARNYNGKLGALGCILEDRDGNRIHSYGRFPHMSDDIHKLIVNPIKKGLRLYLPSTIIYPKHWMKVHYITGADLFVSRHVLDDCGAFNPAFFMYYEETEMQYRFARHNYENVLLNGPRIIHLEGEGGNIGSSKFIHDTLRQQKSEYIYFKLTEPYWKYCLFRIIHPILRQTVWLNPNISFSDKWKLVKQLFITIKI